MTDLRAVVSEYPPQREDCSGGNDRDPLEAAGVTDLSVGADLGDVALALRQLASLLPANPLERRVIRARAVTQLKRAKIADAAGLVDAAFPRPNGERSQEQGQAVTLTDPEPWPEPVGGGPLLAELERTFARFVALPEGAATALALWTVHAHALDAAFCSPLLVLTSPERRCGKTTTLKVLGTLVPRSLPAASISPAALFRGVEKFRPTLLLDEADTAFRESEELRAVVNAAHDRAGAVTLRTVGDTHEPRAFSTWCAKAIALIGKLPGTLADRAIVVPMRRRRREEPIERLRLDRLSEIEPLRRQAWRWAQDHLGALREVDPDVPTELHDRAADNWRPLLAIADAVGGRWPSEARKAALLLSGGDDGDEDAPAVLLLADLRALFAERGTDRLATDDILAALTRQDDRPWPEWRRGKPLTARGLARLVGRFDVRPRQLWMGEGKVRGYELAQFTDAFARYLPSVPVGPVGPSNEGANPEFPIRYEGPVLPDANSGESLGNSGHLPDLPDGKGGPGLERDVPLPDEPIEDIEQEDADPDEIVAWAEINREDRAR